MSKKTVKKMNAIEAAFQGFKNVSDREYKRFVEDLKQAGDDCHRVHTNRILKNSERDLEDAVLDLEKAQRELEKAKKAISEEAITEAFVKALENCRAKGAQQTFQDVVNAINPDKNKKNIKAAEKLVEEKQKIVDEKQAEVDKNKKIISVIEMAQNRLFNLETEVEVDSED